MKKWISVALLLCSNSFAGGGFTQLPATAGGGGISTMGAFGAIPNANGGSISGSTLTLQPADLFNPGGVSLSAQEFSGDKTFHDNIDIGGEIDVDGGVTAGGSGTFGDLSVTGGAFSADASGSVIAGNGTFNGDVNANANLFLGGQVYDQNQTLAWNPQTRTFSDLNGQDALLVDDGSQNIAFEPKGGTSRAIGGSATLPSFTIEAPSMTGSSDVTVWTLDGSRLFDLKQDTGFGKFYSGLQVGTHGMMNAATQSTVNGSTSGSCLFSEPEQGTSKKEIFIHCATLVGTASYTYPVAMAFTPGIVTMTGSGALAAAVVTSVGASAVTITGPATGEIVLLGQ